MNIFVLVLILFTTNLSLSKAKTINYQETFKLKTYEEAKGQSSNYLGFIVKSKKIGFITSDIDGLVKKYSIESNINIDEKIIKNINVKFKITSMDTDNESRNEKLHDFCLDYKKNSNIIVKSKNICVYKDGSCVIDGEILIRKEWFPIRIKLKVNDAKGNEHLVVVGEAETGLKKLKIPDPSIFVAKLLDKIRIKFKVSLSMPN